MKRRNTRLTAIIIFVEIFFEDGSFVGGIGGICCNEGVCESGSGFCSIQ